MNLGQQTTFPRSSLDRLPLSTSTGVGSHREPSEEQKNAPDDQQGETEEQEKEEEIDLDAPVTRQELGLVLKQFKDNLGQKLVKDLTKSMEGMFAVKSMPPVTKVRQNNGNSRASVPVEATAKSGEADENAVSAAALERALGQQKAPKKVKPQAAHPSVDWAFQDDNESEGEDGAQAPVKQSDHIDVAVTDEHLLTCFAGLRKEHVTVFAWVGSFTWDQPRNLREAQSWAQCIDAMFAAGCGLRHKFLIIALRRLCGLQLADSHRDWTLCDVVQSHTPGNAPIGLSALSNVLKQAKSLSKNQKPKHPQSGDGNGRERWVPKNKNLKNSADKFDEDKKKYEKKAPSTSSGGDGAVPK